MKIIAVAVVSANGKLTDGNNPHISKWTSKEDSRFFRSQILGSNLIVMGSGTYEVERDLIHPDEKHLRIVLTKNPDKYLQNKIPGQLEFSDEEIFLLVQTLEKRGYSEMLLVGGSEIYSAFLSANLIDEFYLTIEPFIFGSGKALFKEEDFSSKLELLEIKSLNKTGTILLKYKVKK